MNKKEVIGAYTGLVVSLCGAIWTAVEGFQVLAYRWDHPDFTLHRSYLENPQAYYDLIIPVILTVIGWKFMLFVIKKSDERTQYEDRCRRREEEYQRIVEQNKKSIGGNDNERT